MSETLKVPTTKMVNSKGDSVVCDTGGKAKWEALGYYPEGSKPAPAPKKTTKKTSKKWSSNDD
jgi:hypothetical protein